MWIKQAFRDYYKPKLKRELKRDPNQEEMDQRFEEIYSQVNCTLLAGVLEGVNSINSDNFILEIVDTPKISFSVLDNKPLVENQEFDLIIEISNPSKYILDNVELSNANFTNLEFINEIELSKISTIGANDKIQLHAKLKPIQADTEVMFDPTITYIFREQNIDVFFQEYKNIANENIINRYVPTTFLGIIFVLATIIIAQRNLKK